MVFYICHIYSGHSSVFISLQLLYQQNCSKWAVFVETWRVVTERERGWPERHLCVENGKDQVENEINFIVECPLYAALREKYNIVSFSESTEHFVKLITSKDINMLKNLSDYIQDALLLSFIEIWGHMQMMLQMDEKLCLLIFMSQ